MQTALSSVRPVSNAAAPASVQTALSTVRPVTNAATPTSVPRTLRGTSQACALEGTPLPSLDDSDDVIHLDVQLVWLLEVLKGPHVSRLSLGHKHIMSGPG